MERNIKSSNAATVRISKYCPVCGWRLVDKVTPTSGIIEIKCPRCTNIVKINLAYRNAIRYRLA